MNSFTATDNESAMGSVIAVDPSNFPDFSCGACIGMGNENPAGSLLYGGIPFPFPSVVGNVDCLYGTDCLL